MTDKNKLVIVVPVYKEGLNPLEQFSVDYLLQKVPGRQIVFVGPKGLNRNYYSDRYRDIPFQPFEDRFFASIIGYNHLLLDPAFYRSFSEYDYMLIYQTDALIFRDDLDLWMARGFDYIGAPWPSGVEINLAVGRFAVGSGVNLKPYVGNGGFSLRSIPKSIEVLKEFDDIREYWVKCGSSEDLFFAFMGMLSESFAIPNQMIASRFALELDADKYYQMNGSEVPTGCHAWCKHDLEFWKKIIAIVG